jgi:hypothetical protein
MFDQLFFINAKTKSAKRLLNPPVCKGLYLGNFMPFLVTDCGFLLREKAQFLPAGIIEKINAPDVK